MSSVNTSAVVARVGLNGINLEAPVHPDVLLVRIAERTLRQAFKDVSDISIQEVDLLHHDGRALIVASIQSHRFIRVLKSVW